MQRTTFSCLSLSSLREVAVACSSYVVKRIRYCMLVLAVLCCKLNKYYMYLAIAAILMLKWGASRLDMASRHCCHIGFSRF
jgi:hypothetical protein